jgi:hypothetical protein
MRNRHETRQGFGTLGAGKDPLAEIKALEDERHHPLQCLERLA